MKLAIIGTGYVGLPTGVGFAELGVDVVCIDRDVSKIEKLQSGKSPLFEEGLDELLAKNLKEGRLKFTTSMAEGVKGADVVMIAVGTPPHPVTKQADMKYIYAAATELADHISDYAVVATKSTVPVGTGDDVVSLISKKNPNAKFDVVSLPEFLREGFAVYDFFNPDRVVIGFEEEKARDVVLDLYKPFAGKTEFLCVGRKSSETIKYASNAFLAMKIHYINEMANFCEKAGANIAEVSQGMGLDSRIGNKFLNAGPGYGGSCFPKDTQAMAYMGKQNGACLTLINATIKGNKERKIQMAERILAMVKTKENPKIAVLGLAFKNGTDDCRESPAIEIIAELLEHNVEIVAYDPKAMDVSKELLGDAIKYGKDMYSILEGADCVATLTEWQEFSSLDLKKAKSLMKTLNIADLRNLLNKEEAIDLGFNYTRIG